MGTCDLARGPAVLCFQERAVWLQREGPGKPRVLRTRQERWGSGCPQGKRMKWVGKAQKQL